MTTRVIRTTRRIQTNNGEPIEVVHEREVNRVLREHDEVPVNEDETALVAQANAISTTASQYPRADMHPWLRAMQNVTGCQIQLLRNLDFRLRNIEEKDRFASEEASLERATWWTLWAILMVILTSALILVIALIISSLVQ